MKDNLEPQVEFSNKVVNCFQKLLSSWWRTTLKTYAKEIIKLWIAFKNYYLRDEGQLSNHFLFCRCSCELLSKIIIFVMKDNKSKLLTKSMKVVNCFQKLLSSWWRTTKSWHLKSRMTLWIAFKNYYLRDEGQLGKLGGKCTLSCELLSKIIIFVMKDNLSELDKSLTLVVNCFQKLLSSWWRTTVVTQKTARQMLWIAFKNYYLRDEGQLQCGHRF